MRTRIVRVMSPAAPEAGALIADAAAVLGRGGLVAFPTETVYGLGADAFNEAACAGIYEAKGRPSDNPLIVHIAAYEDILRMTDDRDPRIRALADAFWPGPLTMIVKRSARVPDRVTGGLSTVAVRWPSHPVAQALILASGGYIAAPSANRSGRPSPTKASHVIEDLDGRIDMIIDGGDTQVGLESTIVDLSAEEARILRPGMIGTEAVAGVLAGVEGAQAAVAGHTDREAETALAPGMKYSHYAPKGELTVVTGEQEQVISYINRQAADGDKITGVIASRETADKYKADVIVSCGSTGDGAEIARHLYGALREMDARGAERIFSEAFAEADTTGAIRNRLMKAAAGRRIVVAGNGEVTTA
ncbi:MAG: threonylcarbamoyl-AMP synthase [Lachnospiraceae bacterium]|nr:threonylcarbamoyl-AMP synthase [Lachnospiraceae bacterium]